MKVESLGTLATLRVKVGLTVSLVFVGTILCLIFYFFPSIQGALTYAMAVVASLAVVFSGYYLAATLQITIHRDKIHRSFEFTKQLNDVNVTKIRVFVEKELDKTNMSPSAFYAKVIGDPELFSAVKSLLGIFEDASIAVQSNYVDEPTLYKSLSFLVPWAADKFSPYIDETRKTLGSNSLYSELEKLSDAWKSGKSLNTGEAI